MFSFIQRETQADHSTKSGIWS